MKFRVYRYDPDADARPRMQDYEFDPAQRAFRKGEGRLEARIAACHGVVDSGAQGINICGRCGLAAVLLGRRIPFGADHRAFNSGLEHFRNPKIDQHDIAAVIDHHVRRFHIPENDRVRFMFVQIVQHIT